MPVRKIIFYVNLLIIRIIFRIVPFYVVKNSIFVTTPEIKIFKPVFINKTLRFLNYSLSAAALAIELFPAPAGPSIAIEIILKYNFIS